MTNPGMPCKGCEDRQLHCHSSCERYKEYRAILDDNKNEKQAEREVNSFIYDTKSQIRKRYNKRRSSDKKVRLK